MSARGYKMVFYGSQSSSQSGRCSALGFEAQDTRYYSTPASGPSRARSAESHSCPGGKFVSLNLNWERVRYLEQKRPNGARNESNEKGMLSRRSKKFNYRKQQPKHSHRLACCCSGHCATCSNAMHGSDWSRQIALLR
uniref:Uncharacterized protein n=1 Tax=Macrostomum lignano TaxID=282301 RepID=A0A1I8I2Q4_9PLAT